MTSSIGSPSINRRMTARTALCAKLETAVFPHNHSQQTAVSL
ncbi:MAG: hypothetical protein R3C62_08080 [Chloroflexota bacterium]